jgi:serine/threonine protein kinase
MTVLRYCFIEGSQDSPTIKGWLMILDQVKKMHEVGYVHGDLLPRNVLFTGERGYVIDFDLSRKEGGLYVSGYNSVDFPEFRHKGAVGGKQMWKIHDVYALIAMSKAFFDLVTAASIIDLGDAASWNDNDTAESLLDRLRQVFDDDDGTISPNQHFVVDSSATSSLNRE